MQINNRKKVIAVKLRQLFVTIAFIAVLTLLYTTQWITTPLLGLGRKQIALIFLALYLLYMIYQIILNRNFIFFTDEGEKIILRYYSIRPFAKGSHSIEIPKKDFHSFTIRRSAFYLRPEIVLFQRLPRGIGKFPAISISSLSNKEITALKACLTSYSRK